MQVPQKDRKAYNLLYIGSGWVPPATGGSFAALSIAFFMSLWMSVFWSMAGMGSWDSLTPDNDFKQMGILESIEEEGVGRRCGRKVEKIGIIMTWGPATCGTRLSFDSHDQIS